MKYKLVCSDVDGTLIDWDGNIPEENRKAIEQLEENGIIFAISTGRLHRAATMVAELLKIHPYVISSCGMSVETPDRGFLLNKTFDPEVVDQIIGMKDRFDMYSTNYLYNEGMIISSDQDNYEYDVYDSLNRRADREGLEKGNRVELLCNPSENLAHTFRNCFNKVSFWTPSDEHKKPLIEYLKTIGEFETPGGIPGNIELTPKGVTKWTAIEIIMKRHGIKPEEVVCIGDSMNDAEMIKHAGLGIAVGNASDEVKSFADVVTDTNENAGFAKAINRYVLEQ